jgi:hypothetical protein
MLRLNASLFLCGHGVTHTEHKLHIDLASGARFRSDEVRENFAIEVEARERVRVRPTQTIGQAEVDELLNLHIGRRGVGRPAEGCDDLASLDADEIVPEFDAVTIIILRDDERAEGSVDVELGFFIFHVYRIAQRTKKARDFFTIKKYFFCA